MSKSELQAFIALLYVQGAYKGKYFFEQLFGVSNGVRLFSRKYWQEIVSKKYFDFFASIYEDPDQHVCKRSSLPWFKKCGIDPLTAAFFHASQVPIL